MAVFRLALLELRRFRGQPTRHIALVAIILVPLLYGSIYLWANWDPYGRMDQVPVAVVNEDAGATVDGKHMDAGAQFEKQLKSSPQLDWNFVSAKQANKGMSEGDYYFSIVVPKDFSQKLATLSQSDPQRAHLLVNLDDANGYIAGIMAKTTETELQNQINTAVYATFAKTMFGDLTKLHNGLDDAADGASDLADGAEKANDGANDLSSGLGELGDGAEQVSEGVDTINDGVQDNKDALIGSLDTVQEGSQLGSDIVSDASHISDADLEELCPLGFETEPCQSLQRVVHQAHDDNKDVQQLNGTLQGLTTSELTEDAQQVQDLADGADAVSEGINGRGGAIDGADKLANGTNKLAAGSDELAKNLDKAADQVPSMDADQNAKAADVLGTPVTVKEDNAHPAGVYGRGMAPFFFAIALWVFGLVAFMVLRTINPRAVVGKINALTAAAAGWMPSLILGMLGAMVLYLVADVALGLRPINVGGTIGLCLLTVAAFTAMAHFLRLAFDAAGDVLILVLLMLQLTSAGGLYPMETTPTFFSALHPYMPMTYVVDGLRVTISGGNQTHLWISVAVLAGVTVLFVAASTFVTMGHRKWSMYRLRPAVEL